MIFLKWVGLQYYFSGICGWKIVVRSSESVLSFQDCSTIYQNVLIEIKMYFQYTKTGLLSLGYENILTPHTKSKSSMGSVRSCKDSITFVNKRCISNVSFRGK